MNGQRKPRRPRWAPQANTMHLATIRATRLTEQEVQALVGPVYTCFKALREGVASEDEWCWLASVLNVAQAIDRQGVVRGLKEHLHSAELALQAIERRAMADGAWKPTALYYQELDHVATAVELYEYQVRQLSAGELIRATDAAEAEVRSSGGRVHMPPPSFSQPAKAFQ